MKKTILMALIGCIAYIDSTAASEMPVDNAGVGLNLYRSMSNMEQQYNDNDNEIVNVELDGDGISSNGNSELQVRTVDMGDNESIDRNEKHHVQNENEPDGTSPNSNNINDSLLSRSSSPVPMHTDTQVPTPINRPIDPRLDGRKSPNKAKMNFKFNFGLYKKWQGLEDDKRVVLKSGVYGIMGFILLGVGIYKWYINRNKY